MFKRFIKAVKDAAKRVWEFIKKLLPKPKKEPQTEPEEAARIAQENKELTELHSGNKSAIKVFTRLFGK